MIATLNGTVSAIGLDALVVEVGGIGYLVHSAPQTLEQARHGQAILLHTELVVREDSLTLFGFLTAEETDLFRTVQSVSGIGPRIALAVLAVFTPGEFGRAIVSDDVKALTRVPGVGPKSAKRILLELKEKAARFAAFGNEEAPSGPEPDEETAALPPNAADVVTALLGLGWSQKQAEDAVTSVLSTMSEDEARLAESSLLLRLSLRSLGGQR
ncbi:Holliday junction branch migration protein RuvA [Helcobacillus massiliensis]|uniref:Holliday junction branch migration protein RuvA n=1 Tax=Helcobacillus TaxID=1161125 RepID=UPI001EF6404C|nr:Holliday junction branch migration protein RuvA [Helcobacillus massiliensis]MCG7426627.1 Holliday junction branch migration protein RuvA [Helcobacillus sp. ACRRO]MCT1557209.1 Holliday junction branch migration protein RuvA [Helcobacillus massiliensis]MCT2036941.1 Holliday junction branch migration protein RuvA [Helcobacillus massiliensis]MCT2332669.1 Holliday junction branch migration protein RuvA [Helcobacillus massiliensis]